jgi:hypothetical protein
LLDDLASSLGAQGQALALAERHANAAGAFGEGLTIIVPFVERHAQVFGGLAGFLRREYIAACGQAGTAPDSALLERVGRARGDGPDAEPESKATSDESNF